MGREGDGSRGIEDLHGSDHGGGARRGFESEGVGPGGLVMTHLSPTRASEAIAHSTRPLYLVIQEFQKYGATLAVPYKALPYV